MLLPNTPKIGLEFSGSVTLVGKGAESDEGIEVHGREKGNHYQARRRRKAGRGGLRSEPADRIDANVSHGAGIDEAVGQQAVILVGAEQTLC